MERYIRMGGSEISREEIWLDATVTSEKSWANELKFIKHSIIV